MESNNNNYRVRWITYPFPNFNGAAVPADNGYVISSHTLFRMWLFIHVGIEVKFVVKQPYVSAIPTTHSICLHLNKNTEIQW